MTRRTTKAKAATPKQRKEITFKGLDIKFRSTNEAWAAAHLPAIRTAIILLKYNDDQLQKKYAEMVTAGIVPETLDFLCHTKNHLEGIVEGLRAVLSRSFLVLGRLGYSPENPPPERSANVIPLKLQR
jgi:hypothetical protein